MKKNIEKTSYEIFIDIDASSLGFLLLEKKDSGYKNIFEQRRNFRTTQALNSELLFGKLSEALDEFLSAYKKHHKEAPEKISIQLSEPWSSSSQFDIHYGKDETFVLDEKKLNEILNQNLHEDQTELKSFEKRVCDLKLNGYPSSDYLGKQIHKLDLSLHYSSMAKDFFESIEHQIEKYFICEISWLSRSFLYYNLLQEMFEHEEDYFLLDISASLTQLLCFKKRHLQSSFSIPFGKDTLVKKFAEKESLSFQKAHALIEMYAKKKLSEEKKKKYSKTLSSCLRLWLAEIYSSLSELSKRGYLPHVFVVSTDDSMERMMASYLKQSAELSELGLKNLPLRVLSFEKNFNSLESVSKNLIDVKDPRLAAFVYFLAQGK